MRAKFIHEKFTADSDPIRDLGIGLYHKRNFNSYEDMYKWMYECMPAILKLKSIEQLLPENIHTYGIEHKYVNAYSDYINEYITVQNKIAPPRYRWFAAYIRERLKKEKLKESLNEKFTADSDPIRDLGIGLYHKRNFNSYEDMYEWLYKYMPAILKIKDIKKILAPQTDTVHAINISYASKYGDYIRKYITVKNEPVFPMYVSFASYIHRRQRKESLNEKFTADSDPIHDMNIGYPEKQTKTKAWKILKFIQSKGEEGASFTEIQHFIWTALQGGSEKEFWKKDRELSYWHRFHFADDPSGSNRQSRGNYCTNLYGTGSYSWSKPGLLHKYCKKNNKGKWVLVRMPKPYELFYK